MIPRFCFLNGRYVEVAEASISALDRGFLFGEGLFETWRTYNGRPFALDQHLLRMKRSAVSLGIPFDSGEAWEARTRRLAKLNRLTTGGGAVRLTITAGCGSLSLLPSKPRKPTRLMLFRPLEAGLTQAREQGVSVHLMDFGRGVNPSLRQLKTLNYLPAVIGKLRAHRRGCFESLYRLADSTVLEGTTSNFFLVKGNTVVTPPVAAGILPGITRALVLKLARRMSAVEERSVAEADLFAADEIILTSSSIEVVPVTKVDGRKIGGGRVGKFSRELQLRYRRHVARRMGVRVETLGE